MGVSEATNDQQLLADAWLKDHYDYIIGPGYFSTPSGVSNLTLLDNMVGAESDKVDDCRPYRMVWAVSTITAEAGQIVAIRATGEPIHHVLKLMYSDLSKDLQQLIDQSLPAFSLSENDWYEQLESISRDATAKYGIDFTTLPDHPSYDCEIK